MNDLIIIVRLFTSIFALISLVNYHLVAKPEAAILGKLSLKKARKRFLERTIPCSLVICLASFYSNYFIHDRFDLAMGIFFSLHFVLGLYLYWQIHKEIKELPISS